MKILVVKDIEREDVEFISKTCGCMPIANIDTFHPEKLGKADLVEEVPAGEGRVSGCPAPARRSPSRGVEPLVLDESERSLDALWSSAASSRSGSSRRAAARPRCR